MTQGDQQTNTPTTPTPHPTPHTGCCLEIDQRGLPIRIRGSHDIFWTSALKKHDQGDEKFDTGTSRNGPHFDGNEVVRAPILVARHFVVSWFPGGSANLSLTPFAKIRRTVDCFALVRNVSKTVVFSCHAQCSTKHTHLVLLHFISNGGHMDAALDGAHDVTSKQTC